ncbi:hypothetical protein GOP47_0017016 [Adiantum capillus-veneris]|uniref:RING-type domain-containing protein n=1 Tax=Adiantum capillus-veneris TaxID=13818 RepID=A0A9D4UJQ6_ADICA|nr:hypothetical protein GOP47_0017016 [Adiantum capillus-veneris]
MACIPTLRLPEAVKVIQCNVLLGILGLSVHLLGFSAGAYVIAVWLFSTLLQLVLVMAYTVLVIVAAEDSDEDDSDDDELGFLYTSHPATLITGDEDDDLDYDDDVDDIEVAAQVLANRAAHVAAIERLPVFDLAVACKTKLQDSTKSMEGEATDKGGLQNLHMEDKLEAKATVLQDIETYSKGSKDIVQHMESQECFKAPLQEINMESTTLDIKIEYTCGICLEDLSNEDKVFLFPNCRHFFHMPCVLTWLSSNGSCPICRELVIEFPTAVAAHHEVVIDVELMQ